MTKLRSGRLFYLFHLSVAILSYLFLYIPILILVIFSFNTERFPSAWTQFTLRWYEELLHATDLWRALFNSFIVSTMATVLSLILGIFFIFFCAQKIEVKRMAPFFYGNIIVPEIMLAISLLGYFTFFKVELGFTTLIIAHTILGLGFIIPMLYVKYAEIDAHLYEVSCSLGASSIQTFWKVTLPLLRPTLLVVGLLIFVLSFDDFVFSYFCSGTSVQNLSLYLLSMLRLGISPMINALSTFLFMLSGLLALICFSMRLRSRII